MANGRTDIAGDAGHRGDDDLGRGRAAELDARYDGVMARVHDAARRSGRGPSDIIVVAATKYAHMEDIRHLMARGHVDFGENRVQQLIHRAEMTLTRDERAGLFGATLAARPPTGDRVPAPGARVRWHMIGPVQRNKARKFAEYTRLIHSLDSLRLAEELQAVADKREAVHEVLIQVNLSGEESKGGCAVPAALPLAEQIDSMIGVRVRGLMTMAPYSDNPEDSRRVFARCRELFDEMTSAGLADGRFDLLSMGMSNDFEVGIEEGANIVRIGSAIFGDEAPVDDGPDAPEDDDPDDDT